jgi:hypothetical protein
MFLLRLPREEICEPGSNKLFWKKAKRFFDGRLQQAMVDFRILGPKESEFKAFETINYCKRLLEEHVVEEVQNYSNSFEKLFRWLDLAIKLRMQDIVKRKAQIRAARENRMLKIKAAEERATNRETYLAEAMEKFKEDNREQIETFEKYEEAERIKREQEYGEEEGSEDEEAEAKEVPTMPDFAQHTQDTEEKFDDEFPEIEIPEEVAEQIDNDWVLSEEDLEALIGNYN